MSTSTHYPQSPSVDLVVVHDDAYAGWVFHASHPTQGRRFGNALARIRAKANAAGLGVEVVGPRPATRDELALVHTPGYLAQVLDEHCCEEWAGPRPDLAGLAALFAGGTLVALDALLSGRTRTAVHLPGAKHHAHADHSSGFCVLADFALAATLATRAGLRVAILDIDAHHGDGTEALTAGNPGVCTVSIHQQGIFPGTGLDSDPGRGVYNLPLPAGAGDLGLLVALQDAFRLIKRIDPDLILLAAGADGHVEDPLSSLGYTTIGYRAAARMLREEFPTLPILIGGAGGYRPDDTTPEVWAEVATEVAAGARGSLESGASTPGPATGPVAVSPETAPEHPGDVHRGMSVVELTGRIRAVTRREVNRAKAPAIAAALRAVLPGVSVRDKVGMFDAEELWLTVDGVKVGALASNHLWLAPEHMDTITTMLRGRLQPLDQDPPRWRGWVRIKFAPSHDPDIKRRRRPDPGVCPVHHLTLLAGGLCEDCKERAA